MSICIDLVYTSAYDSHMNEHFVLQGMAFVWNLEKARQNPLIHDGIAFEQAVLRQSPRVRGDSLPQSVAFPS